MQKPTTPPNEQQRLKALKYYKIVDSCPEQEYNNYVWLASYICKTPVSLITLVDKDRQWFKAKIGVEVSETPRDISFCGHTIVESEPFVIEDATKDQRFFDNPLVADIEKIRFYAGVQLSTKDGYNIGTLCVIDRKPNKLDADQLKALKTLAAQIMEQLEMRVKKQEIEKLAAELSKINDSNRKLISIISHDLKSPLTNLQSILNLYLSGSIDDVDLKKYLSTLYGQVNTSVDLVNNLVGWALSHLRNDEDDNVEIDLETIIDCQIAVLETLAIAKNITIKKELGKKPLQIKNAEQVLSTVLRNLLNNAIKFTQKGGLIVISSSESKDKIKLSVKDNGVGMSKEFQKHLFNWTKKQTMVGTQGEKGIGVGLLLCNELIEGINGKISYESTEGKGSVFTITLPKLVSEPSNHTTDL